MRSLSEFCNKRIDDGVYDARRSCHLCSSSSSHLSTLPYLIKGQAIHILSFFVSFERLLVFLSRAAIFLKKAQSKAQADIKFTFNYYFFKVMLQRILRNTYEWVILCGSCLLPLPMFFSIYLRHPRHPLLFFCADEWLIHRLVTRDVTRTGQVSERR